MAEKDGGMRGEGVPRGLVAQVQALREGMEGVRAHLDEIGNPPDYSEDLRGIETSISRLWNRLEVIEGSPAFSSTPEDYARLINEAAGKVAVQSGEDVAKAEKALMEAATVLERTIRHQEVCQLWGKYLLLIAAGTALAAVATRVLLEIFG